MIAPNQPENVDDPLAGLGFDVSCLSDPEWYLKERFLAEYRKIGQECSAAIWSGAGVKAVNRWKREDPAIAEAMEVQYKLHVEDVIREAYKRAIVGEPRLKFHKGDVITVVNPETGEMEPYIEYEKSDRLMLALLEVLDPRFKREQSKVDINLNNSTNIAVGVVEDPAFYGNKAHELIEHEPLPGLHTVSRPAETTTS
ncbi:MAG: hypothetical protein JSS49_05400 [Planctomycetes bacterium]|nr:hypothetical protein [Planctomycetota bacterium]